MKKGVRQKDHIKGGRKVIEAGIKYAAFIMPRLGSKNLSKRHIADTVKVLNEIVPTGIRIRSSLFKKILLFTKDISQENLKLLQRLN